MKKVLLPVIALAAVSCGHTTRIQEAENTPVTAFPAENVRLTEGPFRHAQDLDLGYLLEIDADRLLAPYLKEAGLKPKAENYTNWENTGLDGHIGGHYLSALAYMYAATGNEEIGRRLDYMLSELKRAQDAAGDGYLCGVPGGRAMWAEVAGGDIRAGGFDLNGRWVPLYNIHKTYAGLKDAWLQTHREDARDMLVALADWMETEVSQLSDEQIQEMLRSEHGGLNEIFADVAAITGDDKYMRLAHRFSHNTVLEPLLQGEDRLTGMHANTQIPKVIGFKRIADLENNADWEKAVEFFWDDVTSRRSVSIGGNSVREHFHSPDDFSSMLESEQGPETCNTYNMLRLTRMLYESSGKPSYMDYGERAIFNHILSSQNHDTGGFVYFTPMRSGHYRVYSQPQTSFWCCVGSGMENHARYGEYIYAADADSNIYVNLFIPSQLSWNGNTLEQHTDFPASDKTTITVNPANPSSFAVKVRVPGWTDPYKTSLEVNGSREDIDIIGGYLTVDRTWQPGDSMTVTFPMELRAEQLPDSSPNYSFLYGPIVLAADLGTDRQDGLMADDSRGGHIAAGPRLPLQDMPVIVTEATDITECIKPVEGEDLVFTLSGVYPEKYEGLRLVPFSSLNECRYMVYWPVMKPAELQNKLAETAAEQQRRDALDARTADMVICGEQQPESDHFVKMDRTETGYDGDTHWRRAWREGWFSYNIAGKGQEADIVRISYRPEPSRSASVLFDGKTIGTIESNEYGAPTVIEIPVKINDPQATHTIKIAASKDKDTPNIYEIRLMKSE